jgi:hypothetical protein
MLEVWDNGDGLSIIVIDGFVYGVGPSDDRAAMALLLSEIVAGVPAADARRPRALPVPVRGCRVSERVIDLEFKDANGNFVSKVFDDLVTAREWAWARVGRSPELGTHYAVGESGATILPEGCTLAELFPPLEVLAERGCRVHFVGDDNSVAFVDQDVVLEGDADVWVTFVDCEPAGRTRVRLESVAEFLPADGPGCAASAGPLSEGPPAQPPATYQQAKDELRDAWAEAYWAWCKKHGAESSDTSRFVRSHLYEALCEAMMGFPKRD